MRLFIILSVVFNLCNVLISAQANQKRLSESELSDVAEVFTYGGGLDTMRRVLDHVRRLESESTDKQDRLESVFKKKLLFYNPSIDLDQSTSIPMDSEFADETEKMMSTVLYQLYDEWEDMIKPLKDAFQLDDIRNEDPQKYMYTNGQAKPFDLPITREQGRKVNETVKRLIDGLSVIPKVLSQTDDIIERATIKLENDDIHDVDKQQLQDKILSIISKVSDKFQFA